MIKHLAFVAFAAFTVLWLAVSCAQAQPAPCVSLNGLKYGLEVKFGEHWIGTGTTNDGWAMNFYADPEDGSYTMFVIPPGRNEACIIAAGKDLDLFPPEPPKERTLSP